MEALAITLELRNSSAAGYRVTFTCPGKSLSWCKDTNYDALELIYKDLKQDFPDLCKLFPSTGEPDASAAVRSMERVSHALNVCNRRITLKCRCLFTMYSGCTMLQTLRPSP